VKAELLGLLRCPKTGQKLLIESNDNFTGEVQSGMLVSEDGINRYPIVNGIPRFVDQLNYADNFGAQWNMFRKTQLDSYSGVPISSDRFWLATNWKPESLKGQWVLDVGCGAGRFAEVALKAGAKVVALDYSSAADACYENLKDHRDLYVVQGDIYALPFADGAFPYIYSLGVLQHTPDVAKAFNSLPPKLSPGGHLCVDYYWKRLRTVLNVKYLLRPFTKRMEHQKLFKFLQPKIPALLMISRSLGAVPLIGKGLKRLVPVADYDGIFPLTKEQLREWALLDTFDALGPQFDSPQTFSTVRRRFEEAGLINIEVGHWGHLVGRGTKPNFIDFSEKQR
jgi:SAM-dependent methyltransferase